MRIYEVFLRKEGKEEFRHAGALEAPDPELAQLLARESYTRRGEGDEMWLVDRAAIVEVEPDLLVPNTDKPHRHNDGSRIARWRKAHR